MVLFERPVLLAATFVVLAYLTWFGVTAAALESVIVAHSTSPPVRTAAVL
jgi:hypothetical protein